MEAMPEYREGGTDAASPYSASEIAAIIKTLNLPPGDQAAHLTIHKVEEAARLFKGFSGRGNGPDLNRPPGLKEAISHMIEVERRLISIAFQLDELRNFTSDLHPEVRQHVDNRQIVELAKQAWAVLETITEPQRKRTRPTSEAEIILIDHLARIWEATTGKEACIGRDPANGKLGPFARFVFAALAPLKKDQVWAKEPAKKKPLTPVAARQLIRKWMEWKETLPPVTDAQGSV